MLGHRAQSSCRKRRGSAAGEKIRGKREAEEAKMRMEEAEDLSVTGLVRRVGTLKGTEFTLKKMGR